MTFLKVCIYEIISGPEINYLHVSVSFESSYNSKLFSQGENTNQ